MYRSTVSLTEKMLTDSSQLNESPGLENTDYTVFLKETVPGLEYGFSPKCSCVGILGFWCCKVGGDKNFGRDLEKYMCIAGDSREVLPLTPFEWLR